MTLRLRLRLALVPVAMAAAAALLAGCGSKGIVRTPAALQPIEKPALQPEVVWARDAGGSGGYWSSLAPAVAEDAVFAASENGDVTAYARDTGKTIWSTETDARVISGPTVAGDLVLVGTMDAKVIALQRSDGKVLWRADAPSEVMAPPVVAGRLVVVRAVDGRVFGLEATHGRRVWSFDRNEPDLTLRGQSQPLVVGNHVLLGLDNGKVVSLSLTTGKLAWEQTLSVPSGRSQLQRLVDVDADLLAGPLGVYAVSYGNDLALLNPDSGDVRWRRQIKSYSGMALHGKDLYVTDDDGYVWALDATSGAERWEQKALKYRQLSPPTFFDGYVVVGDLRGYLHWLRPSDGKIVARAHMSGAPIITAPVASGDKLYTLDTDGDLVVYRDAKPDS